MNKTFALLVALALAGTTGLAITLSGSWRMDVELLPTPALGETTLELTYTPAVGWDITSRSVFSAAGFVGQEFGVLGLFGPFRIEGSMEFSGADLTLKNLSYVIPDSWSGLGYDLLIQDGIWEITGPRYAKSALSTTFEFGGIAFGLEVEHLANHVSTLAAPDMIDEYLFYLDFPAYLIGPDSWTLQPHPVLKPWVVQAAGAPYPSYFLTYERVELVATVVTFQGVDLGGNPVTHVLTGMFEVYYFDAGTNTVILTLGADTYLWYYIAEYGAANGWDLDEDITYAISIDDVVAWFMFPSMMSYTFTAELDPLALKVVFVDYCSGIQFSQATVSLTGLGLCCGITLDAELGFSKAGFQYLSFSGINIPLCCGISLDVGIRYGVDGKNVTGTPKFAGIVEGCLTVWGEPQVAGVGMWTGLSIDGFRISCTIADCNYLEYVHAFRPTATSIPKEIRSKFLAACGEYEYLELGFCGPGCCGGDYQFTLRALWGTANPGLLGLTRFVGSAEVPILANLTVNLTFEAPVASCATQRFALGWTFTF